MALIGHIPILSPQTISNESPIRFVQKANANWGLSQSETQNVENRVEQSLSSLFGEGLLTRPAVSFSGSALQVTFGPFEALLGACVSSPGATATVLASQTEAPLYYQQDGTFTATLPTAKTYFVIGTYSTDANGVTAFNLTLQLVVPKLVTVGGTVSGIAVPSDANFAVGYLDHHLNGLFVIDGVLSLSVSPNSDFTVQELYPGAMVDLNSDYATSSPQQRTNGGFWYRLDRKPGATYAAHPTCDLTYSRTGLAFAQ